MKIDKLGVRKALLKAVSGLSQGVKSSTPSDGGNSNNTAKDEMSSSSSKSLKSQVQCKGLAVENRLFCDSLCLFSRFFWAKSLEFGSQH
jgi:hypothetical protein